MFCETTTKGSSWTPRTTLKITFHLRIRVLVLTTSRTLNTLNLLSRKLNQPMEPTFTQLARSTSRHLKLPSTKAKALQSKGSYAKKGWRKPKNEIAHLRKDVHYGQFLQVPKGQRDIFVRKERRSNAGSLIAAIIVLAIIAAVVYFLWTWMSANWGVAVR